MKKFRMLKTLVYVLRSLGWVLFIGGIAASVLAVISPAALAAYGITFWGASHWTAALVILLVSVFYTIVLLGVAEVFVLMMSAEESLKKLRDFFTSEK